ncbi:MAG: EpsD family peptidyl-prolyl cis-trans isomerase [Pseudomonadota bacterium]
MNVPSRLVFLLAAAALLAGCEKPGGADKSPVVATVAGEAIRETELNQALARLGDLNEAQRAEARSKLLQLLIDQRLVAAAARKAGVDKEPAVAAAMAQASRQALAEAYVERSTRDIAKPSESEIAAYYAQHPELFGQRRIYRVQELELKVDPARRGEIEAKLQSSRSMGDFVDWLREQGIEGKAATAVKPAEQIPEPLLARLAQMRDGQVALLPSRPGYVLVQQLLESQTQPVTLEQAAPAIERALLAQKRKAHLEAEVKKLREAAKIEYASGFAPPPAAGSEGAPAAAGKTDKPAQE